MQKAFTVCATVALMAALAAGCAGRTAITKPPLVKVGRNARILFVPLRNKQEYYYDHEPGIAMARSASYALEKSTGSLTAVNYTKARGPVRTTFVDNRVTTEIWAQIGAQVEADYVVSGSVDSIRWSDPADSSLPRCYFTVSYAVINVAKSKEIYRTMLSGEYPVRLLTDKGVTVFQMGPQGLKDRAYEYIGRLLGRTFYRHEVSVIEDHTLKHQTGL